MGTLITTEQGAIICSCPSEETAEQVFQLMKSGLIHERNHRARPDKLPSPPAPDTESPG